MTKRLRQRILFYGALAAILAAAGLPVLYTQYLPSWREGAKAREVFRFGELLGTREFSFGSGGGAYLQAAASAGGAVLFTAADGRTEIVGDGVLPWLLARTNFLELNGVELKYDPARKELNARGAADYLAAFLKWSEKAFPRGDFELKMQGFLVRGAAVPERFTLSLEERGKTGRRFRFATDVLNLTGARAARGNWRFEAKFSGGAAALPEAAKRLCGECAVTGGAEITFAFLFDRAGKVEPDALTLVMTRGGTLVCGEEAVAIPPRGSIVFASENRLRLSAGSLENGPSFRNFEGKFRADGGIDFHSEMDFSGMERRLPSGFSPAVFACSGKFSPRDGEFQLTGTAAGGRFAVKHGETVFNGVSDGVGFTARSGEKFASAAFQIGLKSLSSKEFRMDDAKLSGSFLLPLVGRGASELPPATCSLEWSAARMEGGFSNARFLLEKCRSTAELRPASFAGQTSCAALSVSENGARMRFDAPAFGWSCAAGELRIFGKAPGLSGDFAGVRDASARAIEFSECFGASRETTLRASAGAFALRSGRAELRNPIFHGVGGAWTVVGRSGEWRRGADTVAFQSFSGAYGTNQPKLQLEKVDFRLGGACAGKFSAAALASDSLRLSGGEAVLLPDGPSEIRLNDLSAVQNLASGGGVISAGKVEEKSGLFRKLELLTERKGEVINFFGTAVPSFRGDRALTVSGAFAPHRADVLQVAFKMPRLKLESPLFLRPLAPDCGDLQLAGTLSLSGSLATKENRLAGDCSIRLADAEARAAGDFLAFSGVSGALALTGIPGGRVADAGTWSFHQGRCGRFFPLGEGVLTLAEKHSVLLLERLSATAFGGGAALSAPVPFAGKTSALSFLLADAPALSLLPGAEGRLSGSLDVSADSLAAVLSGRKLKLRLDELSGFVVKRKEDAGIRGFALAALSDFDADKLELVFLRRPAGTELKLQVSGAPAKVVPFVYESRRGRFRPAAPDEPGFSGAVDIGAEYRVPAE